MSTLNVANVVNAYVEAKLQLGFTIYNDIIPDTDNNAACLRYDPAPAAEDRYIDGTRLVQWNLAYYVRNKNRTTARQYADEITAALDPQTACKVSSDILDLTGLTRIVVTHSLDEKIMRRYDRILVMKNGRLEEQGTFDELMTAQKYFHALFTVGA